jgi:hypothetical protein
MSYDTPSLGDDNKVEKMNFKVRFCSFYFDGKKLTCRQDRIGPNHACLPLPISAVASGVNQMQHV